MHGKGWKFTGVTFPGVYHFEQCEPENVTYRLDYNQEGIANKQEYVQLFADCGWEYLLDFVGYSYFRKSLGDTNENEEIFCDDESRLDMMKRVFRGRIVPLIIIFFGCILPQFIMNMNGHSGELYISIGQSNEKPVFYGNTYDEFRKFEVEIQEAGIYQIKCSGKRASGKIEIEIN